MPAPRPVLSSEEALEAVGRHGFGDPDGADLGKVADLMGVEIEWLAVRLDDLHQPADAGTVAAATEAVTLPGGSRVSFEPGGQVELSSVPLPGLDALGALAHDASVLGDALADAGVGLVGLGLEPGPLRPRRVHTPRYDAMEAYFDADGPAGRTMMRATAALQVNVGLGVGPEAERRWRLAHDLGPLLAAAFANSPFTSELEGRPSGWRSTRLAVWQSVDPLRTAPVANGADGRRAWARYALSAPVMMVQRPDGTQTPVLPRLPFGRWITNGHEVGWPTGDDLTYHLTTLFPPIRPRGWLELRMIDALPAPWWAVASAVAATLLRDRDAGARVAPVLDASRGGWVDAARHGLAHPGLANAARRCFAVALDSMRGTADDLTLAATEAFVECYVARGRCPADERLDAWTRSGALLPPPENGGLVRRRRLWS